MAKKSEQSAQEPRPIATPLEAFRNQAFFSKLVTCLSGLPDKQGHFSGKVAVAKVRKFVESEYGQVDRAWLRWLMYLVERKRVLVRDKIGWFVLGDLKYKAKRKKLKGRKARQQSAGIPRREILPNPRTGGPMLRITVPKPGACGHKELKDFTISDLREHFPRWALQLALKGNVSPQTAKMPLFELRVIHDEIESAKS